MCAQNDKKKHLEYVLDFHKHDLPCDYEVEIKTRELF